MKNFFKGIQWFMAGIFIAVSLASFAGFDPSQRVTDTNPMPVNTGAGTTNSPATYSVAVADFAPATSPTDVMCITGSATQTIYITRAQFSVGATTSSSIDAILVKRTSLDTGAASAVAIVSHDSANPAPSVSAFVYTANPSALGAGTMIRADEVGVALDSNGYPNSPFVWDFGTRGSQPIVLRGTSQAFCFNMNAMTQPSGVGYYMDVEFFAK
jgi:hypothetical protein